MSEYETHDDEPEVVPVEVASDHDVYADQPTEEWDAADGEPDGEPVDDQPGDTPVADAEKSQDWQAERYEHATVDPEYAAKEAIVVDEGDQGSAWEYGTLANEAALEGADDLEVHEDSDDTDEDDEEV